MASDSSVVATVASFADARWQWLHDKAPKEHTVKAEGAELVMAPSACKDMWKNTYYNPRIDKYDAEALVLRLPDVGLGAESDCMLSVTFKLVAKAQFDQAGVCVCLDADHWLKAGIEFVDGAPMLSAVVTNGGWSDWSTQPIKADALEACSIRLQKKGQDFVVEVGDGLDVWSFFRIAHLNVLASSTVSMGVFACCPTAQNGCVATFRDVSFKPNTDLPHKAA